MSLRVVESLPSNLEPAAHPAPRRYSAWWGLTLLASDVTMFVLSSWIAAQIWLVHVHHWTNPFLSARLVVAQAFYVCLWAFIFERLGLYRRSLALTVKDELYYTTAALLLGTLPQLLLFTIAPEISTSRAIIALSLPFSIVMVGVSRALLRALSESRTFRRRRRIAIVGKPDRVAQAFASLDIPDDDSLLLAVDEMDGVDGDPAKSGGIQDLEWFHRAKTWRCNMLLLTEMVRPSLMPYLLEASARSQMRVAFAPPRIQCLSYKLSLEMSGRQALIVPSQLSACTPRAILHKRIFDLVVTPLMLAVALPVMVVAAAAVYLESGGPVLYRQTRVGRRGRTFEILKFRSMKNDAESGSGPVWASDGDDRRTRVGAVLRRYSIDELPQLFNVLKGDMSLVGPRPERPVFVEAFRLTLPRYDERHLVQPGITGWSQVHMRRVLQTSDAAEKLKFDLQYIENWSPFLDVSVLVHTAIEILFHRGA